MEQFPGVIFEQIGVNSCLQGAEQEFSVTVHGQDEDFDRGVRSFDYSCRLQTAQARQRELQNYQVRDYLFQEFQEFRAIPGFTDDRH